MGGVHLNNMIPIQLKKRLEEKGLPTTGTMANLEMWLEQAIQETEDVYKRQCQGCQIFCLLGNDRKKKITVNTLFIYCYHK